MKVARQTARSFAVVAFRPDGRNFSLFRLASLFSVSDASGRYSSQFHFGNGFWLGSSTLCKELNVTDEKGVMRAEQPPFPPRFHVARLYLDLPKEIDFSVSHRREFRFTTARTPSPIIPEAKLTRHRAT